MKKLYSLFLVLLISSCITSTKNKEKVLISLNSLTYDYKMSTSLTYSAFIVLSGTSSQIGRISKDFNMTPILLDSYKTTDFKKYTLFLNKKYKTYRGEKILAGDIRFTIENYLVNYEKMSFVFNSILNADKCKVVGKCKELGVSIIDDYKVEITLTKKTPKFIEKLFNPWFIVFKNGKPLYEKIGECTIPYQTGKFHLVSCDKEKIVIEGKKHIIEMSKKQECAGEISKCLSIVNNNPGDIITPSLAVMTMFGNPNSKLSKIERRSLLDEVRKNSNDLSSTLKLNSTNSMISSWLSSNMNILPQKVVENKCPAHKVKILLDTSLPDLETLKKWIGKIYKCDVEFNITNADKYFYNFEKNDFGIAWFTPDELDFYNFYSSFDCNKNGACYFNWEDPILNDKFKKAREITTKEEKNVFYLNLEKYIMNNGYAAPISEMNWWILDKQSKNFEPIHPSGLAEVKLIDFLR